MPEKQVLISLRGVSRNAPAKVGRWIRSNHFDCHLWGGHPVSLDEFHKVANEAIDDAADLHGCRVSLALVDAPQPLSAVPRSREEPPAAKGSAEGGAEGGTQEGGESTAGATPPETGAPEGDQSAGGDLTNPEQSDTPLPPDSGPEEPPPAETASPEPAEAEPTKPAKKRASKKRASVPDVSLEDVEAELEG